ncbi:M17 family metallopeptidase [Chlamydiota bacterium]
MQNVQFLETLEGIEADLLILRDRSLQKKIDAQLKGALSFNLKHATSSSVWMTTNGAFPIRKLVIPSANENLGALASEKRVVIVIEGQPVEKLAFEILLSGPAAETLIFVCEDAHEAEKAFRNYRILLDGIVRAKDLISTPANLMPPAEFAKRCQALEKQSVQVDVLDEKKLKEMGAEALLAVGQGSIHPPRMVVMQWRGSAENPIVLIGKGICFDAGGINLKTSCLTEMKWDKAGAGVVLGILDVVSKMQLPVHVVGIAVLAENMPDGAALKPGDVIATLGGKRVEIIDTDCEGRLALADGIAYAQKRFNPRAMIDLGTLTVETFGALGREYAGLFCNDVALTDALIKAGEESGEKLWPLPLGEYYANQVRSKIADLKNVGVFRYGASSAAAEFLRAFVSPEIPWAHIDISGTAWDLSAPDKGVTGFGIQLLVQYLQDLINQENR